jgi:hypothetical protein
MVVITAVWTGMAVVAAILIAVVVAGTMVLLTGAWVWTCRPAAETAVQMRRIARRRVSGASAVFRIRHLAREGGWKGSSMGNNSSTEQIFSGTINLSRGPCAARLALPHPCRSKTLKFVHCDFIESGITDS